MQAALLYLRVSSKGQEDNYSLDAQEKLGIDYARKNNLEIVKIWKGAESAWGKKERRNFNQMMDYAKRHKSVKHIIFDILDRMTRNDFDKIKIKELIEKYGKTVHFSRTNKIYSINSSPDDEFMMDIEVAVAKKMSNDISRKTRMGMQEKAEQGIFPSNCPLGYLNNKTTRQIDIDTVRAPLIQELFQKVATGRYSIPALRDELSTKGLRHKTRNSEIRENTLYKLIYNPIYYGVFRWGGKLYQGKHTPLISKELWDIATKELGRCRHRPHNAKAKYAFSGLFTCGTCNMSVIGEKAKGKYTYYRCSFSKGQHEHKGYMREEEVLSKLETIVGAVKLPKDISDLFKEGIKQMAGKQEKIEVNQKTILQAECSKAKNKLSKLYDLQLEDNIDKEMFLIKQKELTETIISLEHKLSILNSDKEKTVKKANESFELISNLGYWYQKADNFEKSQILRLLGSKYILAGRDIKADYRTPFNYFAEANKLFVKQIRPSNLDILTDTSNKDFAGLYDEKAKSSNISQWGG